MKLCYWKGPSGNFGDDLNLWLWDFLLPEWRAWDPERYLVGVGTILNQETLPRDSALLVVGSGAGYGTMPELKPSEYCDIRCVRGADTARRLGLPEELGIIDPAVMVSKMPEFQGLEASGEVIFVPHWTSVEHSFNDWERICEKAGMTYVSPVAPAKEVIGAIACARLVIAESMHAIIIADAFRVPWHVVGASPSFNFLKWKDWGDSLAVEVEIHDLYSTGGNIIKAADSDAERVSAHSGGAGLRRLFRKNAELVFVVRFMRRIIHSHRAVRNLRRIAELTPSLSPGELLEERIAQFKDVLEGIKSDYA